MNKELRYFSGGLSVRSVNGVSHLMGIACPYERVSRNLGGFRERVKRGAFRSVLDANGDTFALVNHNQEQVLGRTSSGTLQLRETDDGLAFDIALPNTQLGQDVSEMCTRGDLRECSYGFVCGEDVWGDEDVLDEDTNERCKSSVRNILSFRSLTDVSLVYSPANFGTGVKVVRSLFVGAIPAQVQAHMTDDSKEFEARRARMAKRQKFLL
jgi:HK97 family phage prohead protease